jgi:hypothetical protein
LLDGTVVFNSILLPFILNIEISNCPKKRERGVKKEKEEYGCLNS